MSRFLFLFFIASSSLILHSVSQCIAQEAVVPRPSPIAIASARFNDAYIKVTYSQPHKKGRQIFGHLVPFGKIWRTGANEATEITVTKAVQMNGSLLPAGTYSLFTIPESNQWTIIINSEPGLWGSYNYNEALDVMRFTVPVESTRDGVVYEAFILQIDHKNELADLLLMWDRTSVRIPMKFIIVP